MARPRDVEKRKAILDATTFLICSEGLSVPTSRIAKEAGVSAGTVFLYFATKAELLNQLYLELKGETAKAFAGLPLAVSDQRQRLHELWSRSIEWAMDCSSKRIALTRLMASPEITSKTREEGQQLMQGFEEMMRSCYAEGKLKDAPVKLVASLMSAVIEATIAYIQQDPEHADLHRKTSFEALWGMVS